MDIYCVAFKQEASLFASDAFREHMYKHKIYLCRDEAMAKELAERLMQENSKGLEPKPALSPDLSYSYKIVGNSRIWSADNTLHIIITIEHMQENLDQPFLLFKGGYC